MEGYFTVREIASGLATLPEEEFWKHWRAFGQVIYAWCKTLPKHRR